VVFLNYSAVDPVLTNEKCSYWHFRFDAHADMRMTALMSVLGRQGAQAHLPDRPGLQLWPGGAARGAQQLAAQRPDVKIVGDELHPMARVKDFAALRHQDQGQRRAGGADRQLGQRPDPAGQGRARGGFDGSFYTFYGNALGAPAAIGDAGIGKVVAVADWFPNVPTPRVRGLLPVVPPAFSQARDDYVHMRMQLMIEALAQAIERAGRSKPAPSPRSWNGRGELAGQSARMRAADHQFQQPWPWR
jgi:branched-chain amino acid transport system substrate-binding protein